MRIAALVCFGLFLLCGTACAEDPVEGNPVEAALKKPPATGLLVTFATADGQALQRDIRPGDILVSYAGTAVKTSAELKTAMESVGTKKTVECVLVRAGERLTREVAPGRLGVNLIAVAKDKPPAPLPACTLKHLDLSPLKDKPREVWYAFSFDGRKKVGFEHGVLRYESKFLVLRHEIAFDGGERWGINHQVVTATVQAEGRFVPDSTRYEFVPNHWIGLGTRRARVGGDSLWEARWPPADGKPVVHKIAMPEDLPIMPTYLVETLASFMPRRANACFHYRPLNEGMGTIDLPSALFVVGEEEIEQDGGKKKAWKIELRGLGTGKSNTWWVASDGTVLRIHYGQAWANVTTKEKALSDLPEGITPEPAGR